MQLTWAIPGGKKVVFDHTFCADSLRRIQLDRRLSGLAISSLGFNPQKIYIDAL